MFGEFNYKKHVDKNYGNNALFVESSTQIFGNNECIIEPQIEILICNSYNLPLRKYINGKLLTLPKNIHTIKIIKESTMFGNCIGDFNQSLDYLPDGLENLILNSSSFNLPLDNLPQSLIQLKINCNLINTIDISYLKNLKKLESYTSNFVSIPKSVTHLIVNNTNQILDPECNIPILEINQVKFKNIFGFNRHKIEILGPIPENTEYLIIKSLQDYTIFQNLPISISKIQISDEILKNSQNTLDNLPSSVTLIIISVDKLFFDFIKNIIKEIEKCSTEIKTYLKDSNVKFLQRVCEIFDITNKIKIPFNCDWSFCSD
jgi:hypothetical protein